ncbi:MAG: MFS transporter [Candidatus Atribacteria bacterium]|nr:MFS transporter [Candidatus Atribacteria bacterium]
MDDKILPQSIGENMPQGSSTINLLHQFENLKEIIISVGNFLLSIFSLRLTWTIILGIAVLFFVFYAWKQYKKRRENLLTSKLKQELDKSCKQKRGSIIKTYLEQLYLPSWFSVISVIIVGVAIFLITHIEKLAIVSLPLKFDESNHYQNLIAIHAGIGAIIFALLIFIAESLRDDETKDRARVLLKESFLFPLTVAELLGFFIFVWGNVNIWAILVPLIVALLTIASLWRLLLILLSKSRFAEKRLQLLKDRIKRSIDLAISERFGNTILLQSLGEGKIELDYNPFPIDADDSINRQLFYSDKTGVITNIRLDKLNEFAKLLESEANKNGFSFYKDKAKQEKLEASSDVSVVETGATKFQQANRQFLHKKFRDEIDTENQLLISIDKNVVKEPEVLKELNRLAKEIFIIKKQDNFSEEIKLEIDGLKDQFIAAIEAKKLGKIEELMKTYISLSESFLEALNTCGGGYTYEQARKERGTILGGWNEIRWLSDGIREILIKATQTHDQEIIRDVAYIPVGIAIRAIKAGDQYVYQEFLAFPSFLYWQALKETNNDVREFMVDRSWRHLKEMSDFYIEHQLKRKVADVESVKKYRDFTIPIFVAFQNLLKTAFDKRDFNSFQSFLNQFSDLYHDFEPEHEHPNAEYLEHSLAWVKDVAEREKIRRKIEVQKEKEAAAKDIQSKKHQVILGLSAWIFEQYRNKKDDTELAKFYKDIINRLPGQLPELTEIFVSSRQFETERFWDWDNWEMISDGKAHFIDFNSKLDRLYCVRSLLILQNMSEEQINAIILPHSRELAYLAEDKPDIPNLVRILNDMVSNSVQWSFVLPQAAIDKTEALKKLLITAKENQEKSEEEYLKTVKIDGDKLNEFNTKVIESFYESGFLRPVIKIYGGYNDLMSQMPGAEIPSWGYNQIDEKAAFIKDWHVHYSGWGENYGSGLAKSEDNLIFERMLSGIKDKQNVKKEDIISKIEEVLKEKSFEDPVILQTLDHLYEYEQIRRSEAFISRYSQDCQKTKLDNMKHGYMGVMRLADYKIPVVDIFVEKAELKNKILILDLQKFGKLNQYSPIDKPEDTKYLEDIFFIKVTDLNEDTERRQKIINENPVWLQKHEDKDGYLQQKVLINIYEKFEWKTEHPEFGFILDVSDLPASDDEK